jgi:hypothetical protein
MGVISMSVLPKGLVCMARAPYFRSHLMPTLVIFSWPDTETR